MADNGCFSIVGGYRLTNLFSVGERRASIDVDFGKPTPSLRFVNTLVMWARRIPRDVQQSKSCGACSRKQGRTCRHGFLRRPESQDRLRVHKNGHGIMTAPLLNSASRLDLESTRCYVTWLNSSQCDLGSLLVKTTTSCQHWLSRMKISCGLGEVSMRLLACSLAGRHCWLADWLPGLVRWLPAWLAGWIAVPRPAPKNTAAAGGFHAVAREFLIIDEYMGKTFVVQDRVMATMPKKKQWQMAYIFGVFCTKPVADAVERKLEEVKSETVYQKIAELIMDSVSHPAEMFPVHSIFSATIHRKLVQQTVADAKATMRDNGFYVPTRMPRLRLRDAGNHTRSKLNVMTQLRSMKMRSTKTFGKKTCGGFSPVSATNTKMVGRFGRSVRISMITCSLVQVRGGV
eukprot:TRINITY_DN12569_c0_g2_i1.p1 TRINITY_DN12569_c0_g2~~TRINITY_DN12569_c0_g2_i1.p1  ORF type:complete len:401 (+),score=29.93 TRINITY_DN12569_c0_g2_i1:310-1512(+)